MSFFPFTFQFIFPGLPNPFSRQIQTQTINAAPSRPDVEVNDLPSTSRKRTFESSFTNGDPRAPVGLPPEPINRKRGWAPSASEPCEPQPLHEPRNTYVNRPPQTIIAHDGGRQEGRAEEEGELELPAAKRQKGITGSVITTAFNAAVIGAAVGLTMFRMWNGRGKDAKEIEQTPPPPYQEEWAPLSSTRMPLSTPPKPPLKQGDQIQGLRLHGTPSAHKRRAVSVSGMVRRNQRATAKRNIPRKSLSSPKKSATPRVEDLDFEDCNMDVDDTVEMDWIGDKLSQLIAEGKRALGTEVVVSSESPEDEFDDGSGDWIEDENASASFSMETSRSMHRGSGKKSRLSDVYNRHSSSPASRRNLVHSRGFSDSVSAFGSSSAFQIPPPAFQPNPPAPQQASMTYQSVPSSSSPFVGSPSTSMDHDMSESDLVRISMEKARAAYRQRRGMSTT